jgi:hypothetical protein
MIYRSKNGDYPWIHGNGKSPDTISPTSYLLHDLGLSENLGEPSQKPNWSAIMFPIKIQIVGREKSRIPGNSAKARPLIPWQPQATCRFWDVAFESKVVKWIEDIGFRGPMLDFKQWSSYDKHKTHSGSALLVPNN